MKYIENPPPSDWQQLAERPAFNHDNLTSTVEKVINAVKVEGDQALKRFTLQFDKVALDQFEVTANEIAEANALISEELKTAIGIAQSNIKAFHSTQTLSEQSVETMQGVSCWRKALPIEKVGLYIPGGTAPLFSSILMLGIPAKIAGCQEIVLCSPPNKEGKIHPAILYTANLVGITKIFKVGGSQAIAAMALGTETIPKVYKIFGPGNQYVTCAKVLVQQQGVAIDMPAGPSEVLVIADDSGNPEFVAADLLSQAEHGIDSQVVLLSDSSPFIQKTLEAVEAQVNTLPRKEIAIKALENSKAVLLSSLEECMAFSNQYAPEHLIIASDFAEALVENIQNAGSVFLGNYSCESAGDYASGTNHTLPTNGFARNYSGVSLDSFVKKITFQKITAQGIQNIGKSIEVMAEAEELIAHKNAVSIRLKTLDNDDEEFSKKRLLGDSMFDLERLIRPNIKSMKPYSSARKEYTGKEGIFLDANENPYGTLNRYPDPLQRELKRALSRLKGVAEDHIFIGNGSDEVIDLALRIFCNPGTDKALTFSPSYGMYDVSSAINDVELIKLPLNDGFQIDLATVKPYLDDPTIKLIFVCSPNNPTGNCFRAADIQFLLEHFKGIVIVDEAYADFSEEESWVNRVGDFPNLIVSQTFSKAWGLAAARVGMAFATPKIIELYNGVKPPYNVSKLNQEAAIDALLHRKKYLLQIDSIKEEKVKIIKALNQLDFVQKIYPSDANFVLLKVRDANAIYQYLIQNQIIVRNRTTLVNNCIRITVGTEQENESLLEGLSKWLK